MSKVLKTVAIVAGAVALIASGAALILGPAAGIAGIGTFGAIATAASVPPTSWLIALSCLARPPPH